MQSLKKIYIFSIITILVSTNVVYAPEAQTHIGMELIKRLPDLSNIDPKIREDIITRLSAAPPADVEKFISLWGKTKHLFKDGGKTIFHYLASGVTKANILRQVIIMLESMLVPEEQKWLKPTLNLLTESTLPFFIEYIQEGKRGSSYAVIEQLITLAKTRTYLIDQLILLLGKVGINLSEERLKYTIPLIQIGGTLGLSYLFHLWTNSQIPPDEQTTFKVFDNIYTILKNNSLAIGGTVLALIGGTKLNFLSTVLPELEKMKPLHPEDQLTINKILNTNAPYIIKLSALTIFPPDDLRKGITQSIEEQIKNESNEETKKNLLADKKAIVNDTVEGVQALNNLADALYYRFALPDGEDFDALFDEKEMMKKLNEKASEEKKEKESEPHAEVYNSPTHPWYYIVPSARSVFGVPLQNHF